MKYIPLSQIIIFLSYTYFIYRRYGILKSVSDSFYKLKEESTLKSTLFTLFIWALGGTMIAVFISLTPENATDIQVLKAVPFLISGIAAGFLGAAPQFKQKMTSTIHWIGASGLILAAFVGLITAYNAWPWSFAFVAICVFMKWMWPERTMEYQIGYMHSKAYLRFTGTVSNYTWWVEGTAFALIVLGLIVK